MVIKRVGLLCYFEGRKALIRFKGNVIVKGVKRGLKFGLLSFDAIFRKGFKTIVKCFKERWSFKG